MINNPDLQSLVIVDVAIALGTHVERTAAGKASLQKGQDFLPLTLNVDANTVTLDNGEEGGPIELVIALQNCDVKEAMSWLNSEFRRKKNQKAPPIEQSLVVVRVSDVEPENVQWLWDQRLALGKVALLVGDPGKGKSYATCALAASITNAVRLPSHTGEVVDGDVLMFAIEDGVADTIRPRLDLLQANVERVHVATGMIEDGKEIHVSLETGLSSIENYLKNGNFKLIIIDPINAYLGGKVDSNNDSKLRAVLAPMAAMAEKHDVAILCVMHLNKSQNTNVLNRVMGSVGFVGVARTVLFLGEHPTNYQERVIDCVKSNIGEIPPSIAFSIDEGRLHWLGETDVRAHDILNADKDMDERSAVEEACEFLSEVLKEGPQRSDDVNREGKSMGISKASIKRAKKKLGILPDREGGIAGKGYWTMRLPTTNSFNELEQLSIEPVSKVASESQNNASDADKRLNDEI